MFLIITSVLAVLVVLNFLLLTFSCNKTTKKPTIQKTEKIPIYSSSRFNEENNIELAPTGS